MLKDSFLHQPIHRLRFVLEALSLSFLQKRIVIWEGHDFSRAGEIAGISRFWPLRAAPPHLQKRSKCQDLRDRELQWIFPMKL